MIAAFAVWFSPKPRLCGLGLRAGRTAITIGASAEEATQGVLS